MPITVIPADDNSGAIAGWEMLSRAASERNARIAQERAGQKVAYQALIEKLSDPATTEAQQNAILSQDPAQFLSTYGVPITSVGRDIETLRGAADTPAARKAGAGASGAPVDRKRVLVEHPGGTAGEQQAAATLAGTKAGTTAEEQKTAYYAQGVRLNEQEATVQMSQARQVIKRDFRTNDGKVPTLNQTDAFIRGEFDLYPTTEGSKRLETIREIIGGDPNDPAVHVALLALSNDQAYDQAKLDALKADKQLTDAKVSEMDERLKLFQQGIDPDTGKSLTGGTQIDPRELLAVNKGFSDAFTNALGPIGMTATATTSSPTWLPGWYSTHEDKVPGFAAAIFGSGIADPAAVRADLERAVLGDPATRKKGASVKTIKFPVFDEKTGMFGTSDLTLDQAVTAGTQIRRKLATELPALFRAMGTVDPNVLNAMMQGNPLMQQAARVYAPQLARSIDDAQRATAVTGAANAVKAAGAADPNIAGLLIDRDKLQKEIDDLKQQYRLQADPQPAQPAQRNRLGLEPQ